MTVIAFRFTRLAALVVSSGVVSAVAAAAPIFPGDGTVGLEPPPGLVLDGTGAFVRGGASIAARSMAVDAYRFADRDRSFLAAQLVGPGARIEPFSAGGKHGFIMRGHKMIAGVDTRVWAVMLAAPDQSVSATAKVPVGDSEIDDAAIERALHSIAVRPLGLAARLEILRQEPLPRAALMFLQVAAICGSFLSLGAWLFGPKRS